jgi:sodium-coupled neutral amino acid transporter 11
MLVGLVACTSPFWYSNSIDANIDAAATTDAVATDWFFRGDTIFVGLGVLSFAYVCQHSAFIIAGSLNNPTSKRWSTVTTTALILCGILNLICGILGYLGYRENTQGNILENLGRNNLPANIARAMLGVTMLFVYPVESFVTRHVCVVLLFSGRSAHEGNDAHILSRADRRIGLTTALYILAVIPAVLTNDLGPVLAITGTVGGSCLSYLGPGVIYLGVHGERFLFLARQVFGRRNGSVGESNAALSNDNGVGETTPLVLGSGPGNNNNNSTMDYIEVDGVWNHLLWYVSGMPLWCAIARFGKVQLQEHITEMAMKSPHPIRIGDVEYKRVAIPINRNTEEDEETSIGNQLNKMVRDQSMPHLSNLITTSGSAGTLMNINQQIGQGLLEQQKKNKVDRTKEGTVVEPDPQEVPPSWYDFYVAIFLIILGFIALFAGMYSIFI